MATVAQLKEYADTIGVTYTSKIRKDDLIALIEKREAEIAKADAEGKTWPEINPEAPIVNVTIDEALWRKQTGQSPTPLPNSERVQKYARAKLLSGFATGVGAHPAKLTHRQMRRVRKNANKHGEVFKYGSAHHMPASLRADRGLSLLARTPEGLGIFYQFSK